MICCDFCNKKKGARVFVHVSKILEVRTEFKYGEKA